MCIRDRVRTTPTTLLLSIIHSKTWKMRSNPRKRSPMSRSLSMHSWSIWRYESQQFQGEYGLSWLVWCSGAETSCSGGVHTQGIGSHQPNSWQEVFLLLKCLNQLRQVKINVDICPTNPRSLEILTESLLRWHAQSREEQGAYYERAREEKGDWFELYLKTPGQNWEYKSDILICMVIMYLKIVAKSSFCGEWNLTFHEAKQSEI